MDRRAVGEAAGCAVQRLMLNDVANARDNVLDAPVHSLRNCLPKKTFPGYPSAP
jgi:hypothetical protein